MDENNSTTPELSTLERQLLTQIDGLVTERDMLKVKIDEIVEHSDHEVSLAGDRALIKAKDALVEALSDQLNGNDLELGDCSVIFAEFANKLGKTGISNWKNPFKKRYTVKVSQNNDVVMTITGVEAEDEDDAIEIVTESLSIDSPVRKGTLTYDDQNGESDDSPELEEDCSGIDKDDFNLDYEAEDED
jgi:hypothetical protein